MTLDAIKQTLRRTIEEGDLARERLEKLEAYEQVTTGARRGSSDSESGQARTGAGGGLSRDPESRRTTLT